MAELVEAVARALGEVRLDEVGVFYLGERTALEAARSALAAIEAEGWKCVPKEPTEDMIEIAVEIVPPELDRCLTSEMERAEASHREDMAHAYRAMLDAAAP